MTVFISLLRGINVGGHNKIRMEALRELYTSLGLQGAQSLLQSGNVVFASEETDPARLSGRIADAIEKSFGFRAEVLLRTPPELRDAIARSPFADRTGLNPSLLCVTFLAGKPDEDGLAGLAKYATAGEEYSLSGRELYLYYPNGMGRSKLTNTVIERHLKTVGTARNWNTVNALLGLAEALTAG